MSFLLYLYLFLYLYFLFYLVIFFWFNPPYYTKPPLTPSNHSRLKFNYFVVRLYMVCIVWCVCGWVGAKQIMHREVSSRFLYEKKKTQIQTISSLFIYDCIICKFSFHRHWFFLYHLLKNNLKLKVIFCADSYIMDGLV